MSKTGKNIIGAAVSADRLSGHTNTLRQSREIIAKAREQTL